MGHDNNAPRRMSLAISLLAATTAVQALDCTTVGTNLVPSCGFADAGEAADWAQVGNGDSYVFAMGDGNPAGSGEIDGQDLTTFFRGTLRSDCFPVSDDTVYTYGLEVSLVSGTAPMCLVRLNSYSDASCVTFDGQELPDSETQATPSMGMWSTAMATDLFTGQAFVTVQSARLSLLCDGPGDFVVRVDNGIVNQGMSLPVELEAFSVE